MEQASFVVAAPRLVSTPQECVIKPPTAQMERTKQNAVSLNLHQFVYDKCRKGGTNKERSEWCAFRPKTKDKMRQKVENNSIEAVALPNKSVRTCKTVGKLLQSDPGQERGVRHPKTESKMFGKELLNYPNNPERQLS